MGDFRSPQTPGLGGLDELTTAEELLVQALNALAISGASQAIQKTGASTLANVNISGAPTDAHYLTSTAEAGLSAEVNLGALTTGFLYGTVAAGTSTISSVATTGTGNVVLASSPTLVTPDIGAATATSIAIGANILNTSEWANLDGINQTLATTSTPQFTRLGLGQAADASAVMAATGQYFSAIYTLTDGATIALNWNNGNVQIVTLGGNRTFTFANPKSGGRYVIILAQDATGSRTITWPTIKWQGGSAPTLTTTASKIDIITLFYTGTDYLGNSSLNH